jgi:hypothetical protein
LILTDGASFRTPDYGDYSLLVYIPYFALSVVWAFLLSTVESARSACSETTGRFETTEVGALTGIVSGHDLDRRHSPLSTAS